MKTGPRIARLASTAILKLFNAPNSAHAINIMANVHVPQVLGVKTARNPFAAHWQEGKRGRQEEMETVNVMKAGMA